MASMVDRYSSLEIRGERGSCRLQDGAMKAKVSLVLDYWLREIFINIQNGHFGDTGRLPRARSLKPGDEWSQPTIRN
jgi:hypothetical protein